MNDINTRELEFFEVFAIGWQIFKGNLKNILKMLLTNLILHDNIYKVRESVPKQNKLLWLSR